MFVSPEFDFGQNSEWRSQVAHHLNKVTELVAHRNDSCIAHVHISPKAETGWSLEQLRRVAQAVLYFRMAFDIILAPTRKASTAVTIYTREYSDFDTWCERIQNCVDADDLVSWMRLPLHQGFGWDFENAKEDGTIGAYHCS